MRLKDYLNHDIDREDINQVAAQFGVSELVVQHMLDNQGKHV